MDAEKWQKINELFHEALKLKTGERDLFLASSSQGDDKLYGEVRKLLSAYEKSDDFIKSPVLCTRCRFEI